MRSKRWIASSGLLAALALGTAAAQTNPAATVDVAAPSAVNPADQPAAADRAIGRMRASSQRVRVMLDESRRQKDIVKTTCLSDKLAQIDAALKSSQERAVSLRAAFGRGETEQSTHEFTVIGVLRQRVEQLDAEANQCIGEELGFPGETRINFTVDPNIAPADPGAGSDPGEVIIPPLPTSPYF